MNDHILELKNITKKFSANTVLDDVSFDLLRGEVHSLIGENGAGKTMLMEILFGSIMRDSGTIIYDGEEIDFSTPKQSIRNGIFMIHQSVSLIEELTIAQNLFLGIEPKKKFLGAAFIDYKILYDETKTLLGRFHLDIDPDTKIKKLKLTQKRAVEILKAIIQKSRVIIMDEVNASFTDVESEILFDMIAELKQSGVSIIYISHKIQDVLRISNRVSVMRNGRIVDTFSAEQAMPKDIVNKMVGDKLKNGYPRLDITRGREVFRISNVSSRILKDINIYVREGEIVGLAGLMGSGRSTLAEVVFGVKKIEHGAIYINRRKAKIDSPMQAVKAGISYVSNDRTRTGIFEDFNIGDNIIYTSFDKVTDLMVINNGKVKDCTTRYIKQLNIRVLDMYQKTKYLSGGNQQKVVLAKWLNTDSRIYILDDPTAGVDISSKVDFYNILNELKCNGSGILFISSDIKELHGMCDRIYVMYEGNVIKELEARKATVEEIGYFLSLGDAKQLLIKSLYKV